MEEKVIDLESYRSKVVRGTPFEVYFFILFIYIPKELVKNKEKAINLVNMKENGSKTKGINRISTC